MHFQGKNKDLNLLPQQIATELEAEGYKVQLQNSPMGTVIQARKAGSSLLRGHFDNQSLHLTMICCQSHFQFSLEKTMVEPLPGSLKK